MLSFCEGEGRGESIRSTEIQRECVGERERERKREKEREREREERERQIEQNSFWLNKRWQAYASR